MPTSSWRHACALLALALLAAASPLRAGPVGLVTLGDSLTDTYVGKPYAGSNLSWTDQLAASRAAYLSVHNLALAGSTSTSLLSQGQHTGAAALVQQGQARYVTLAVGANDIGAFLQQLNPANPATLDPTPYAAALVGNVATAVATLQAAGAKVMLANVPDIGATPSVQQAVGGNPALLGLLTATTNAVNAQLDTLAKSFGIPLVDLNALNNLSGHPLIIGGVDVQPYLYSIDGFHPSTIGSALLANVELEALRQAYGVDVPGFSDAEILGGAGLSPAGNSSTFSAASFVHRVPEPSTLVLLTCGGAGLLAAARRRRRAQPACFQK